MHPRRLAIRRARPVDFAGNGPFRASLARLILGPVSSRQTAPRARKESLDPALLLVVRCGRLSNAGEAPASVPKRSTREVVFIVLDCVEGGTLAFVRVKRNSGASPTESLGTRRRVGLPVTRRDPLANDAASEARLGA